MAELTKGVSGFKLTGNWEEVVTHGERITEALVDCGVDDDPLSEWDEWRPKITDKLDNEISRRTRRQASVDPGEGEQKEKSPVEDIAEAGKALADNNDNIVSQAKKSAKHTQRAVDTAGRKFFRTIENTVYEDVMTRFTPYYFDNVLVSANIKRKETNTTTADTFVFEVDINSDKDKQEVSQILDELPEIDSWDIDSSVSPNPDTQTNCEGYDV